MTDCASSRPKRAMQNDSPGSLPPSKLLGHDVVHHSKSHCLDRRVIHAKQVNIFCLLTHTQPQNRHRVFITSTTIRGLNRNNDCASLYPDFILIALFVTGTQVPFPSDTNCLLHSCIFPKADICAHIHRSAASS